MLGNETVHFPCGLDPSILFRGRLFVPSVQFGGGWTEIFAS